jgi:hypothetical protein
VTGLLATRASVGAVPAAHALEHLLLAGSLGAVLLLTYIKLHTAHMRRGLAPRVALGATRRRPAIHRPVARPSPWP